MDITVALLELLGAVSVSEDGQGGYTIDTGTGTRPATAAELLDAHKASRIESINEECTARIHTRWPAYKQQSAALGVYGAAQKDDCYNWCKDHVDASNTASNAVLAAATIEDVEAVTVTWPVAP